MIFANKALNDYAMENVTTLVTALNTTDRFEFKKNIMGALEGADAESRGALVNTLYKDVIESSKNIDFGKIPLSYGDVMKLQSWNITDRSINTLAKLLSNSDRVKTLLELENFLVARRSDFAYGFKYDNIMLKTLYNIMTMCMYDLIDSCVVEYANTVNGSKTPIKHAYAYNSAKQYVAMYKSGEWAKVVKQLQSAKVAAVGENFTLSTEDNEIAIEDFVASITSVGVVIAGIIALFMSSRGLIRYFLAKSAKYSVYLKNEAEFLDNISSNDGTLTDVEREKASRRVNKMTALAAWIDTKILKAEAVAAKEDKVDAKAMHEAMRGNSKPILTQTPSITGPGNDDTGFSLL